MTPRQGVTLLPNGSCEPPLARGSSKAPAIAFQTISSWTSLRKSSYPPLKVPGASEGSPGTGGGGGSPCERQRGRVDYTTQGNWVQDKEHGLQFKARFLNCSPPHRERELKNASPAA